MKVGVIGAGAWGKNLVKNFSDLGVLVAVADAVESNRNWVAEGYPEVALFHDADSLFDEDEISAVAIATPPATHHGIAIKAMEKGKDVFVEKPLTLDPEEAEDLCRVAKESDKILMVGHLLLYQPAITFIKEYLNSGNLGSIYTLTQRRSKLGRVRSVENVLWSFGVHDVAVLLHLIGEEPDKVQAFGHAGINENIEDDVHLHLGFPSGIKASLHNSWYWPRVERELIITGEKGTLVFDELKAEVTLHKKTVSADLSHHDEGVEILHEGSSSPLKGELAHFLQCCHDRSAPLSDGNSGHEVVRILAKASQEF